MISERRKQLGKRLGLVNDAALAIVISERGLARLARSGNDHDREKPEIGGKLFGKRSFNQVHDEL